MRLGKFSHLAVALLAVAMLAAGCASSSGGDEVAATSGTGEFNDGAVDNRGISPDGERGLLATIYFDYDSAAIRSDARATLQQNVGTIGQNPSWQMITVEGHCDERGSEEYNLALGERRAGAVKQYLIDSGVSAAKVDTVSFGEAKPQVPGHDESAWKNNRRAEFVVRR